MYTLAFIAYLHIFALRFLGGQFPVVLETMKQYSLLQNGLMFVTLFFFTESIVTALSYCLLLQKPHALRKKLQYIASKLHIRANDSPSEAHGAIDQVQESFDKAIKTALEEITTSSKIFSRFRLKTASSWINSLNIVVLFILLINVQFILPFATILFIFYMSIVFCGIFLIAHRLTIQWVVDPKKSSRISIYHPISEQYSTLYATIASQIQEYIKNQYTPIETILEKDQYKQPAFFRMQGVRWIDLQKGFIVKDPAFKKVCDHIQHQNVMIQSEKSSGKTTFGYTVGYELAKKGHLVLYISFKTTQITPQQLVEIASFLDQGDSYLILDDVHLADADEFFTEEFYSSLKHRILFLRRKPSLSALKNCIQLTFQPNLPSRIIERFLVILRRKASDSTTIQEILSQRTALEKVRNLYELCFALQALQENTPIDSILMETIRDSHAENILLPIAFLEQYEIPIRKDFLQNYLSIPSSAIESSLHSSPLLHTFSKDNHDYVGLSHPSLADQIVSLYQHHPTFGKDIQHSIMNLFSLVDTQKIFHMDVFLYYYLLILPEEGMMVLSRIDPDVCNRLCKYDNFKAILIDILSRATFVNTSISYNVEHSQLHDIFSSFSLSTIESLMDAMQKNCQLRCLLFVLYHYEKCHELPVSIFRQQIQEAINLTDIADLLLFLQKIQYPHLNEIPPSLFARRIQESTNMSETGLLLTTLKETFSPELFKVIIKLLPASIFIHQIQSTDDLPFISKLMKDLQSINYPYIGEIEPAMLVEKIKDNDNVETITWFLSTLQMTVTPSFFMAVIQLIPPSLIGEKIEQCDQLRSIGLLLSYLEEIQYLYITKLSPVLFETKIRMGTNLRDIGMLLCTLQEVCTKSFFSTIYRSLSVNVFIEKIKCHNNLQDIGILLIALHKTQYPNLHKITPSIFLEKMEENPSLSQIETLLTILRQILPKVTFESLVSSIKISTIQEKMIASEDLPEICSFLNALYKNKYRNMHQISASIFVDKIQKTDDIEEIQSLLKTLTRIQFTHTVEILELLDLDMFRDKLIFSKDKEKIVSLLCQLRLIDYPYIDALEDSIRSQNENE
jgi:hypothetical protein